MSDPAPVEGPSQNDAASVAHPSAMTLFAPDPNADPESVSVSCRSLAYFVTTLLNDVYLAFVVILVLFRISCAHITDLLSTISVN